MKASITGCVVAVTPRMASTETGIAQKLCDAAHMHPLKRTGLQPVDGPGTNCGTIIGTPEPSPNVRAGHRSQPGLGAGYMLQGGGTTFADGQPPLRIQIGQGFKLEPAGMYDPQRGADGGGLHVMREVERGRASVSPANWRRRPVCNALRRRLGYSVWHHRESHEKLSGLNGGTRCSVG